MRFNHRINRMLLLVVIMVSSLGSSAQRGGINWAKDGNSYYTIEGGEIIQYTLPANTKTTVVSKTDLTLAGDIRSFTFSEDFSQMLLYTNSVRVWRLETRGNYWVMNRSTKSLRQLGKDRPTSTLMFAKFSPDGTRVAYVSQQNLYVEDVASGKVDALTSW